MISARRFLPALASTALGLALSASAAPALRAQDAATAWASGPLEVVVALPKPADDASAAALVGRSIPYYPEGPGAPLPDASAEPLGALKIAGARAEDGGRTLVLATDPHPLPARYVLDLTGVAGLGRVVYTLGGVEAAWFEGDEPGPEPAWTAWLDAPDVDGFRRLGAIDGNPRLLRRAEDVRKAGSLRLDGLAILPAPGQAEVTIESDAPVVEALFGDGEPEGGIEAVDGGGSRMKFPVGDGSQPAFFSLAVKTGPDLPTRPLRVRYAAGGGGPADPKPIRFLLPWAPTALAASEPQPMEIPDFAGGDPAKGEEVFFSKEALCSQCHVVKGKGGQVGPDLSTIGRKGAEYLYRSLAAPSEAIVPDFVTYTVSMKDGRVAAGVVRAEGPDAIRVIDTEAKSTTIKHDEIEDLRAGATSIMPVGLVPVLGEARLRDLMAYLATLQP